MRRKIVKEFIWLVALLLVSAAIEYIIITFFDLHPVLSVKIQGLIGLLIIAYGIRMVGRLLDTKGGKVNQSENDQVK